jgi:hypothetical protein
MSYLDAVRVCHVQRRIHACHMMWRRHVCHMRRRIYVCHTLMMRFFSCSTARYSFANRPKKDQKRPIKDQKRPTSTLFGESNPGAEEDTCICAVFS